MFDLGIIIAVVGSSIAIVGVIIGMMFWVRSESNDLRNVDHQDRKDMLNLTRSMQNEMMQLIKAMETEMKDFHYRMLEIERNRK